MPDLYHFHSLPTLPSLNFKFLDSKKKAENQKRAFSGESLFFILMDIFYFNVDYIPD